MARRCMCWQAFRIKVEPDVQEQPMSMDISSVVSKPITVLSKRINKPKKTRTPPSNVKRSPGEYGRGNIGSACSRGKFGSSRLGSLFFVYKISFKTRREF